MNSTGVTGETALNGRSLVVVGCGALGSELCRLLLDAAVPNVLLVDPDTLSPRNLDVSRFWSQIQAADPAAIGKPKVSLIARFAAQQHLSWQQRACELADVGLAELAGHDVLLSCTDSTLSRVESTLVARTLRLPMIDGGVMPDQIAQGRVSFFPPNDAAACYFCGIGEARRAELLAFAISSSLGCIAPPAAVPMSGTPATTEAVATAMFALLTKLLSHPEPEPARSAFADRINLLQTDRHASNPLVQTSRTQLSRSASCPWHDLPQPRTLLPARPGETFGQILDRVRVADRSHAAEHAQALLDLPWPVSLRARCRLCRFESEAPVRTARLRRKEVCPRCGATGSLDPLACVSAIGSLDPAAQLTPAQLGFPSTQLFRLRRPVFPGGAGLEVLP